MPPPAPRRTTSNALHSSGGEPGGAAGEDGTAQIEGQLDLSLKRRRELVEPDICGPIRWRAPVPAR